MADRTIDTNESAINETTVIKKSIADSTAVPPTTGKLRVFDSTLIPTVSTVKADLVAAETLLGGYPAGGYSITDMGAALLVSGGGASTITPLIRIEYTVAPGAALGGAWLEDAAGKVRKVFILDPARSLQAVGDGFDLVRALLYGRNA